MTLTKTCKANKYDTLWYYLSSRLCRFETGVWCQQRLLAVALTTWNLVPLIRAKLQTQALADCLHMTGLRTWPCKDYTGCFRLGFKTHTHWPLFRVKFYLRPFLIFKYVFLHWCMTENSWHHCLRKQRRTIAYEAFRHKTLELEGKYNWDKSGLFMTNGNQQQYKNCKIGHLIFLWNKHLLLVSKRDIKIVC